MANVINIGGGAGGSSGGGHTILDNGGTSLTQRTELQFKGAYSVDNSTDQITEVNVVREMTKAEFDLLTDDEKVGIINVTDATSSGDNEFQPICYSEEEREIGVWTDGKPLYQKTVIFEPTALGPSSTFAHNISDIDIVVDYDVFITRTGGVSIKFAWATVNDVSTTVSVDTTNIMFAGKDNWPVNTYTKLYATLRYTKTTDAAGSGTWTPQGVPAVHYSTTEHIVGTWIDGNTLYERTIVLRENGVDKYTFTGNMSEGGHYDVGLTGIDKIWLEGLYSKRGKSGDTDWTDIDNNSTEVVTVFKHTDGSFYFKDIHAPIDIILNIRYTKSST